MLRIEEARDAASVAEVKELFLEYHDWLDLDLCFQGFQEELDAMPGRYASPSGRLLIARDDGRPVGCIALRALETGVCEMKRLYVKPSHRGESLGRRLVESIIREARWIGYSLMVLDTLPIMERARTLYRALGFEVTAPYYENPVEGVVYMSLDLEAARLRDAERAPASDE